MTDNRQHDWFTPEGRAAAWKEIEQNMPEVIAEFERIQKQEGAGQ